MTPHHLEHIHVKVTSDERNIARFVTMLSISGTLSAYPAHLAVNCMGRTYSSSKVHVVGKGSREGSMKPADNINHYGTPPIFTDELKNVKIKLGDTLTLGCRGNNKWIYSMAHISYISDMNFCFFIQYVKL